jgi:hypothetical protein
MRWYTRRKLHKDLLQEMSNYKYQSKSRSHFLTSSHSPARRFQPQISNLSLAPQGEATAPKFQSEWGEIGQIDNYRDIMKVGQVVILGRCMR